MDRLNILWTTNDKDTFFNMISMYSLNSLKSNWWNNVNIIIWGGLTRLTGEDPEAQKELMKNGVSVEACKACADKMKTTYLFKRIKLDRQMSEN